MDSNSAPASTIGQAVLTSPGGAVVLAFVVVGLLSFTILQTYNAYVQSKKPRRIPLSDRDMPRPVTHAELARANGEDGNPLYIAIKNPHGSETTVFDVSSGSDFYGPGNAYHVFVGKDATYGLATSSLDPNKMQGDLSTLTASQKDTHVQWYAKYLGKYTVVGPLVASEDGESVASSETKKDA